MSGCGLWRFHKWNGIQTGVTKSVTGSLWIHIWIRHTLSSDHQRIYRESMEMRQPRVTDWLTGMLLLLLPPPKKGGYVFSSVCLSVCLFVCLSVGLLANLWTDFDEIFCRGRARLKDQVIQFWWRSGSRFRSGSPKSEIRILRIAVFGGGLCSLSISSCCCCLC